MDKPKGGRGIKTSNPTKVIRIEQRLEPLVIKIAEMVASGITIEEVNGRLDNSGKGLINLPDKDETVANINKVKKSKKSMTPIIENLLQVLFDDSNIKLLQVFLLALINTLLAANILGRLPIVS
jgi:hypothetical protein